MNRRLVPIVVLVALLTGCGGDDTTDSRPEPTSSTAPTVSSTPRPDDVTAARIEAAVAEIYPGVPAGKATDWAVALCSDIRQGEFDEPALVERTVRRFAGGDRPDPSAEQAAMILTIIRSAGFCT